jgi:hypothetical protein
MLRPDSSLTCLAIGKQALSAGFTESVSFVRAAQATGFWLLPRWVFTPIERTFLLIAI